MATLEKPDGARAQPVEVNSLLETSSGSAMGQHRAQANLGAGLDQDSIQKTLEWLAIIMSPAAFVLALVAFVGHHLFYAWLDGTSVQNGSIWQEWALRVGNLLAIVFQTSVGVIIGSAATQTAWAITRRKYLRISVIDGMFGLAGDPLSLFNRDLLLHGWPVVVLAVLFWALPLITVFTSPSLSVASRHVTRSEMVPVPRINATLTQGDYLWMRPHRISDSVMGAGLDLHRRFQTVATSGKPLERKLPHLTMSYKTSFTGPALKCQGINEAALDTSDLPEWNGTRAKEEWTRTMRERASMLDHDSYFGYGSRYNIFEDRLRNPNLANESTTLANTLFLWTEKNLSKEPMGVYVGTELVCRLMSADYEVLADSVNGTQTITTSKFSYGKFYPHEGNKGKYVDLVQGKWSFNENGTFDPKTIGAYYAAFNLMETFVTGILSPSAAVISDRVFGLYASPLMDCPEIWDGELRTMISGRKCPYGAATFGDAIQELSKQWAISMLAFPEMANETRTTMGNEMATITEQENYWQYRRAVLLGVYSAGLFAALMCVGLGLLGLWANGWVATGTSFSAFLLASRNPDLDALARARPEELAGTKVRYGRVQSGLGEGTYPGFEVKGARGL